MPSHQSLFPLTSGKIDNVKAFLHPSHVYYPPGGGNPANLDERMEDETFFFKAFSDIKTSVEDQTAEEDKVASRISMHCIQTGEYQGIPPTNRPVAITYMDIARIKNGKIYREWAEFDLMSILNQLK